MVRTNQGGSILGFLIVGGVLALLLVGGAYVVRHQLAPTADKDTESVVTQNSAGDSGDPADKDTDADAPKDTKNDDKKADPNKDEQADGTTTLPGNPDTTDSTNDTPPVEDLPQTGPADTLLSSIFIGSITGVAVAYKRSRNTVAPL